MNTYILSAKRSPIGSLMGSLSHIPAPYLGAQIIKSVIKKTHTKAVPVDHIQECIMGQVLTAGSGQAPARQSAMYAELKSSTQCMTINKVCGSGLKAVMLAQDSISLGYHDVIIAGGQENMSLSPYISAKIRGGTRLGHIQLEDTIIKDGLWDPYNNFHMGSAGELCAREYKITREEQDAFAINSYKKAQRAQKEQAFNQEITNIQISSRKNNTIVNTDEEPGKARFDKIPMLNPVFEKEGTITAANASKINDGAAACLIVSEQYVKSERHKPLARIISQGSFAQEPQHFTTAPVQAIKNCLKRANMNLHNIDLFEINEAFSVVPLAISKDLGIPEEKLNVHGGAVALGHPIGASGARILCTLVYALRRHSKKYGIAAICLGGGEAVSVLIENMSS